MIFHESLSYSDLDILLVTGFITQVEKEELLQRKSGKAKGQQYIFPSSLTY